MSDKPPVVVLSGSDRRPVKLPETGRTLHPLSGYKGVDLRIAGEPILAHLVRALNGSDCFGRVYVAGPAVVHRQVTFDGELIDVDGTIGENIQRAMEVVMARHPGESVAFITCDVLPDVALLRTVMARYHDSGPCDIFYPVVKAPAEPKALGASGWKPTYALVDAPGSAAVTVLPGHLVIGYPPALRLDFIYRLLNVVYRTRNRSLHHRRNVMIRSLIAELLLQDLKALVTLRPPTVTYRVISTGIRVMTGLLERTLTRAELERRARRIFLKAGHRRRHPERQVVLAMVDGLELAMDIDTEEEARYFGAEAVARESSSAQ